MSIGIIIMLFLLTPSIMIGLLIFIEVKRKRQIRINLEKTVNHLIRQNNLLAVDLDYFRDKVIGIDKKSKKLIFAHFKKGLIDQFCIDLGLVSSCVVSNAIDRHSKYVTKILLQLKLKNQYENLCLNFYDNAFDNIRAIPTLLEKARYWKRKINFHKKAEYPDYQLEYVL